VTIVMPVSALSHGVGTVTLSISDGSGFDRQLSYRVLGPTQAGS
jgi:hypothetical protein